MYSCGSLVRKKIIAGLRRGPEIEALDEPASVVIVFELPQRKLQLVHIFEMADPEQLLFEGPEETFNATIPLRLSNEGGRGFDTEKSYFLLKVITHVLTAGAADRRPLRNRSPRSDRELPDESVPELQTG